MKGLLILSFFLGFLGACSSVPMDRGEYLKMSTRDYKNYSREVVIEAARQVVSLLDGSDFIIEDSPNGFSAKKDWYFLNFISKPFRKEFKFEIGNDGVASINLNGSSDQPDYSMFWNRVDYLLGKVSEWDDCRAKPLDLISDEREPSQLCSFFEVNKYPLKIERNELNGILYSYERTRRRVRIARFNYRREKAGLEPYNFNFSFED